MWKFIKVVLVYVISIDTMRKQREKRDGGGRGGGVLTMQWGKKRKS